jgi:hypothetical protein
LRLTEKRDYFCGDAAFANSDIYEYLEGEGFLYAIRHPTNDHQSTCRTSELVPFSSQGNEKRKNFNPFGISGSSGGMKFFRVPVFLMALSWGLVALHADADTASLDLWKNNHPPFSFKYDGKDSSQFIASWHKTVGPVTPSDGGETHHYTYTDPATKLKITADVR